MGISITQYARSRRYASYNDLEIISILRSSEYQVRPSRQRESTTANLRRRNYIGLAEITQRNDRRTLTVSRGRLNSCLSNRSKQRSLLSELDLWTDQRHLTVNRSIGKVIAGNSSNSEYSIASYSSNTNSMGSIVIGECYNITNSQLSSEVRQSSSNCTSSRTRYTTENRSVSSDASLNIKNDVSSHLTRDGK